MSHTPEDATVLGLVIDAPPLDWTPIKVVVSFICLDADGSVDTWHTMNEGTHHFEAMGLMAEHQAILNDAAPYAYFDIDEDFDE